MLLAYFTLMLQLLGETQLCDQTSLHTAQAGHVSDSVLH